MPLPVRGRDSEAEDLVFPQATAVVKDLDEGRCGRRRGRWRGRGRLGCRSPPWTGHRGSVAAVPDPIGTVESTVGVLDAAVAHEPGDALALHPPSRTTQFGICTRDAVGSARDRWRTVTPSVRAAPTAWREARGPLHCEPGTEGRVGRSRQPTEWIRGALDIRCVRGDTPGTPPGHTIPRGNPRI